MIMPDYRKEYTEMFRSEEVRKFIDDEIFEGKKEIIISKKEFEYLIVDILAIMSERSYKRDAQRIGEMIDLLVEKRFKDNEGE